MSTDKCICTKRHHIYAYVHRSNYFIFFCVVLLEEVVLVNLFLASNSKFLLVDAVLDAQFHVKGDDGIFHILINFNCF